MALKKSAHCGSVLTELITSTALKHEMILRTAALLPREYKETKSGNGDANIPQASKVAIRASSPNSAKMAYYHRNLRLRESNLPVGRRSRADDNNARATRIALYYKGDY